MDADANADADVDTHESFLINCQVLTLDWSKPNQKKRYRKREKERQVHNHMSNKG